MMFEIFKYDKHVDENLKNNNNLIFNGDKILLGNFITFPTAVACGLYLYCYYFFAIKAKVEKYFFSKKFNKLSCRNYRLGFSFVMIYESCCILLRIN